MANVHDVAVTWHRCDVEGCVYKAKQACVLRRHMADVHDVDVTWHLCDVEECVYRAKHASDLKRHMATSHNPVYVARQKKQEQRIRVTLAAAGYNEWYGSDAMPPVRHFKREKQIDFKCASMGTNGSFCRIDFVIGVPNGFVFLEVDENQHQYGYDAMMSCDMRRMSHVMESIAIELGERIPCIYWLRYNPNAWRVDGELQCVPKDVREAALLAWLSTFKSVAPLQIGYAFYDCEADGSLDLLTNEEYHHHYAEVVENLWAFNP